MGLSFAAVDVGNSLQRGLDNLIGFLPNLIGFLIILAIGYIIARVVKGVVSTLLEKIEECIDRTPALFVLGPLVSRA